MSYKMTAEQVIALGPCGHDGADDGTNYTPARVRRLFAAAGLTEASAVDILCLGPTLDIPALDRLWLVLRPEFIEPATAVQFALLCAEHIEEHSEAAQTCNAVTRRFLDGAATLEELDVTAWAADMDADTATRAAARAADMVAKVARAADMDAIVTWAAWAAWAAEASARDARDAVRATGVAWDTAWDVETADIWAIEATNMTAEAEWQCKMLLNILVDSDWQKIDRAEDADWRDHRETVALPRAIQ